jgi:citrate lyase beta subunit
VVTLPRVTSAGQVAAMAGLCDRLEQAHGLDQGWLRFEVQVETPQVIPGADGIAVVARCIPAARGRRA